MNCLSIHYRMFPRARIQSVFQSHGGNQLKVTSADSQSCIRENSINAKMKAFTKAPWEWLTVSKDAICFSILHCVLLEHLVVLEIFIPKTSNVTPCSLFLFVGLGILYWRISFYTSLHFENLLGNHISQTAILKAQYSYTPSLHDQLCTKFFFLPHLKLENFSSSRSYEAEQHEKELSFTAFMIKDRGKQTQLDPLALKAPFD